MNRAIFSRGSRREPRKGVIKLVAGTSTKSGSAHMRVGWELVYKLSQPKCFAFCAGRRQMNDTNLFTRDGYAERI